jgi:hypothetical protein
MVLHECIRGMEFARDLNKGKGDAAHFCSFLGHPWARSVCSVSKLFAVKKMSCVPYSSRRRYSGAVRWSQRSRAGFSVRAGDAPVSCHSDNDAHAVERLGFAQDPYSRAACRR